MTKKNSNVMHGLKSAILAIFQKSADWLDWLDWPCPVSPALQNSSQDLFFSFTFKLSFIFLNMKPLSEISPGHSDSDPSSVKNVRSEIQILNGL